MLLLVEEFPCLLPQGSRRLRQPLIPFLEEKNRLIGLFLFQLSHADFLCDYGPLVKILWKVIYRRPVEMRDEKTLQYWSQSFFSQKVFWIGDSSLSVLSTE